MYCSQPISVYVMMKQRVTALGVQHVLAEESDIEVVVLSPELSVNPFRIADFRPDVLITDLDTCSKQSSSVLQKLKVGGGTKILFLYSPASDNAADVLKLGADGLIAKSSPAGSLGPAVRSLAKGRVWIDERVWKSHFKVCTVARSQNDYDVRAFDLPTCGIARFSKLELEVLNLASEGLGNLEIAQSMGLAEELISCTMWLVAKKLRAKGRKHAVSVARQFGICL